jgi:hypothetical protein
MPSGALPTQEMNEASFRHADACTTNAVSSGSIEQGHPREESPIKSALAERDPPYAVITVSDVIGDLHTKKYL